MSTTMFSVHIRSEGSRVQGSGFRNLRSQISDQWRLTHPFSGGGRESLVGWALPTILCCILSLSVTPTVQAQPSSPALDAVLARIEFNGTETPETLGPDLVRLTEKDLVLLCGMLVEPGTGDDTKVRMALHALALYIGCNGTPDQRDRYTAVLCTALESERPTAVKTFLIRQLQLAGDARAAAALFRYQFDMQLAESARQALFAISTDPLIEAFVRASASSSEDVREAALSIMREAQDGVMLQRLAKDADLFGFVRKDQQFLAEMSAMVAAFDIEVAARELHRLMNDEPWRERRRAESWWVRTQTVTFIFAVADQLAETDGVEQAADLFCDLIQFYDSPEEVHVRCAALHALSQMLGSEAVDEVVAALTDEDPELRAAAMDIAVKLGGEAVTETYVKELDAPSPGVRVAILNVLARRGDHAAVPAVLVAFDDESKDVRIAAIKAAAMIGGETVVDPLVACLDRDDDGERQVAEDELVRLRGDAVTSYLADALAESPSRMKCSLLNVLARRRAADQLETIRKYTRHDDETVRIAAINAVGELAADVPTVQRLLLLLGAVEAEDEREAIERALIDVCKRPDGNAEHIATVIDGVDRGDVPEYCSLLRVLGHLGGQSASEILLAAARDPHAEVVGAALRGFASFPDPDRRMTAVVLELAADMTETKPHVLGMRAFAELLKRTETDVPDKLGLYQAGLDSARRVEEKRLLLSGMADVKDTRTLDALAPYLEDEKLRSETGSAMIMAARGTLPKGWPEAHRALERVLASVTEDRVRRHGQDVMKEVERFEGFITDWRVAGPYFVEGKAGHEILDTRFPPEEPGEQNVEWKEQPVNESWDRFWHIDLARSIGGDHRAAYLRTYVWSEHEQAVLLELGSDDGIKAWLNHEVIHTNNALRGCGPAQDKVNATLAQGWNELMLKVNNDGGGWGACARLRSPDGDSVKGVKVDVNGQPDSPP